MRKYNMVGDKENIKARHDWEEDMKSRGNDHKTCGHGYPYYDLDGHYEEVGCDLMQDAMCMDAPCPLNPNENNPKEER